MKLRIEALVAVALLCAAPVRAEEPGTAPGVTEPIHNILLKAGGKKQPPWSGRIAQVLVKEGQVVEAGQPVLEMEKRDEEIEVKLRALLANDDKELRTVKEREKLLRALWQTNRGVAEQNRSVSREEVTKRELEYRTALGERQRLELEDEKSKLELEAAQVALENRTIRAPIKGTVVKIHLHEGDSAESNDPLMQIVDTSKCIFVCNVEEKVCRSLKEGQTVTLRVQAGAAQETRQAVITFVSPVVESASFLCTVKAEFSNADGEIKPGVPGVLVLPTGVP